MFSEWPPILVGLKTGNQLKVDMKRETNKMKNLLHEFWNSASDACPLEAPEQEKQELAFEIWYNIRMMKSNEELEEFREIQADYFDENGKCHKPAFHRSDMPDKMLKIINLLAK